MVSLIVHTLVFAAIMFTVFPKPSNELVNASDEKPMISYLYVRKSKDINASEDVEQEITIKEKKDNEQLNKELDNKEQIAQQNPLVDTSTKETRQNDIKKEEQAAVETPKSNEARSTENINATPTNELTVLTNQNNEKQSINTAPSEGTNSNAKSLLGTSTDILRDIQASQLENTSQQEANAYRQAQLSPPMLPTDRRIDTWEKREQVKVTKVYCDTGLKTAAAILSGLTSGGAGPPKVQCQSLPDFQQFIDKQQNKGAVNNSQSNNNDEQN